MSEVDPDPYDPEAPSRSTFGGREQPDDGDPTDGGKHGQIGETAGIADDEPSDGTTYPVAGGRVTEESDAPGGGA